MVAIGYVPIRGSFRRVPRARWLGPAPALAHVRVTLVLRGADPAGLSGFVSSLAEQPAPERTFLSREDLARQFGASEEDLAAVRRFARINGLAVVAEHPERRSVELAGTVAAFRRAFRVRLDIYRTPRGVFRGRTGRIWLPAWLVPRVVAVHGLDNRPAARPHFRIAPSSAAAAFRPQLAPSPGFSPPAFNQLYDLPSGTDGTGQCIALIELGGGFRQQDIQTYFNDLNIPVPSVEAVSVDGGTNAPTGNPNSADGEVMLDIEVAGALAPGAKIAVYFAPNTDRGFIDAVLAAVHDTQRNPSVISISWGAPEENWTAQSIQSMDMAFQAAAAAGVTVFAAAGDSGASDGLPGGCAHVDFPAADPLVVGCGGTLLQASANAITSETVWNDPGDGATGGGVSRKFPVPAYQASINPVNLNPPHRPGRGVPDVSGNASPVSGYQVLVDGQGMVIGGTSAVAPLWAAIVARLQQQLGHPVAPLHAAIYAAGNAFRDITVGNNGGYSALSGWDACTGLGSPNGTALLTALGGSGGGGAGNGGSGGAGNGGGGEENGGAGGGEEPANPQKPARGRQRSAQEKTE